MKRIVLIIALVAAAGIAVFFFREHPQVKTWVAPIQGLAPSTSNPAAPSVPPAVPPPPGANAQFVEFLGRESISLDSTNVNAEAAERRSLEQAQNMGPLEIQFARDTVLSGNGSANQRVLALYLLTLAGPKAAGALENIALAPLPDGRVAAHSEEEHTLMQEKAQRVTAIDALVEQAKADPTKRDSLERLANEMRDPGLRAYILKKLQEISR